MDKCVFCRIAGGELPSLKVYESEDTIAFMDISDDVDGHMLVVPRKHYKTIADADKETLSAVMDTVRKVSLHLVENCGYSGVNVLCASGRSAGQSVPHLHFHLIPRRDGDEIDAWPVFGGAKRTRKEIWKEIRME